MADLNACVLTPKGRGAVATIAFKGDLTLLDNFFEPLTKLSAAAQPIHRIRYGHWNSDPPEDVVFVRTAEQIAEIHCHGGMVAVQRILSDVESLGGRAVPYSEFMADEVSLFDQQANAALIQATTVKTATTIIQLQQRLKERLQSSTSETLHEIIVEALQWKEFSHHLTHPWKVVLCGRPNVGKSSLINALVGFERSVVYDQPGTTRDVLTAQTALEGWPVEFSDTAGLRESEDSIEAAGVERARRQLNDADLVLLVLDSVEGITDPDRLLLESLPRPLVVWNKCDLSADSVPQIRDHQLWVSAKEKTGVDELINAIVHRLVPEVPHAVAAACADHVSQLEQLLAFLDEGHSEAARKAFKAWVTVDFA